MAVPYSNDLRERIIKAAEKGMKVSEIADIFGVKPSTIYKYKKQHRETGDFRIRPQNQGRNSKLNKDQIEQVRQIILDKPDITLGEMVEELKLPICISALCRMINKKLKLKYKKNTTSSGAKQG